MADSIALQIIKAHLVEGEAAAGRELGLRVDQTLLQDATGTLVDLEFESLGLDRVRTELSVSYVDHNMVQTDSKNMDDHRFLQSVAARYGMVFSPPGNGVSHAVHLNRFGVPGKTLLGSDSHTTTGGAVGMLAIGAGGLDVCLAMAGRPFFQTMPRLWGVRVTGTLPPWVSGKDVVWDFMRRYGCKGGLGTILEFFGPGVARLDMAARATICNMAVDMGATAALFPSDAVTRAHLRRNGRESAWRPLAPDRGASYDQVTELDLSSLEPLVAAPSNPDNIKTMAEAAGTVVGQVLIGSSASPHLRDYLVAAAIMAGKPRHPAVSFEINPASRQVLEDLVHTGAMVSLVRSGARLNQPGCLGCIGVCQAPASGIASLRTFPRNFKGRSGTEDDQVWLCSPEVAAASALAGVITDPRTLGAPPKVRLPARFAHQESWFVAPPADGRSVEIVRGPNIRPLPTLDGAPDLLEATVVIKVGDNVSTDAIMPAGSKILALRSNIPAIAEFVFNALDEGFAARARAAGVGAVVGADNYGQGSSREHAALAPRVLGVRLKLARSFARIHKANLVNFGILPLTFADPADYDRLKQGDRLVVAGLHALLRSTVREVPLRVAGGRTIVAHLDATPREREVLLAGGLLNHAMERTRGAPAG